MDPLILKIVVIGVLGMAAQWAAWRAQIPAVVFLLLCGVVAGPVTGVLDPHTDFGNLLEPLIAVAVAIILFEGGLTLNFRQISGASRAVRQLIYLGAPLAWGLGYLAAHYVAGLSTQSAAVLAGVLVVTGPTVVGPLLRQARLPRRAASLLQWEAIIADPVGALFSVLAFEASLVVLTGHASNAFLLRAALAVVLATGGGFLFARMIAWSFVRGFVPEYLKTPTLFVAVLLGFALTNFVLSEAGLLTVTVMGITLANSRIASLDEIRRFKEMMSVLLVSGVFIILTATIRMADIAAIGWRDVAFIATLLFVVRPATVLLSTLTTPLTWQERLLCAWIAPRGVVAVAVSGFFGAALLTAGVPDAERLAPIAFLVVFVTVVAHGLSIAPLARALGLTSAEPGGLLIVGGSPWTLELASRGKEMGLPVLIADTNWNHLVPARLGDIEVYYGEILGEATEHNLDFSRYAALIAATDNDAYNALVCTDLGPEIGRSNVYQVGRPVAPEEAGAGGETGKEHHHRHELSFTVGGKTLPRSGLRIDELNWKLRSGWLFQKTKLSETYDFEAFRAERGEETEPLFALKRGGRLVFAPVADGVKLEPGDTLLSFGPKPEPHPGGEPSPVSSHVRQADT
jgi:NhaP-type Na+/H+ or K+/H+ antiporter